ncbi:hypothetical protein LCGC14_0721220 [marine sediment metagenome]|uniref:HTH iclR-type domain-containing protein n=1 Tax=marine sediment metagenome TaxID=412755 RepID=A0A0F9QXD1_9ZZZZ
MGLFSRRQSLTSNVTVGLTPLGKTKAEKFEAEGPKFDVLTVLSEQGPSTVSDISQQTGMPSNKVEAIVRTLIHSSLATTMRAD